MSVLWLRTAAALYSCGLLYALIYLFSPSAKVASANGRNARSRPQPVLRGFLDINRLFTPTLIAFGAGAVFHLVSIVELRAETGHLLFSNFYETISICGFLLAVLFLVAYSYFHIAVFGVCLFPLVFFMALIGATEFPVASWSSPAIRSGWLILHVSTVLIGYAALIFSAVASVYYLLQERQLKHKNVTPSSNRLPPLATLDRVITLSMNFGFVFITVATATGLIWAFVEKGAGWIGNPKMAFFLFTWAFYLAMIFLRVSAGWRGRRIAWLAVSVLGCSIITWVAHVGLKTIWLR